MNTGAVGVYRGGQRGRGRPRGSRSDRGRGRGVPIVPEVPQGVPAIRRGGNQQRETDIFFQATSANLPVISCFDVAQYFQNLMSSELRQSKDQISSGADYGDTAIGYVKLKRDGSVCTVRASMTPQTSVNNTPYAVGVDIDEGNKTISNATCTCQASEGSCKHKTALMFWLLRRAEQPSPTEVACYWKRSVLSTVKGIKSKSVDELSNKCTAMAIVDNSILKEFIELGKEKNKDSFVVRYSLANRNKVTLYIDHLMISFLEKHKSDQLNAQTFVSFCSEQMTPARCFEIFRETLEQNKKAEWYYQRFGRITASKVYECSTCNTPDESLVASIMGARKFKGNAATKRGNELEIEVFNLLRRKYADIKKCGIVLRSDKPIFGASPDGISDTFVFEIKCPSKAETMKNYVKDNVVQKKVFYQIQLQMLMCEKKKGILCVADPNFERNRKIYEYEIEMNKTDLLEVLKKCEKFWEIIFSNLK